MNGDFVISSCFRRSARPAILLVFGTLLLFHGLAAEQAWSQEVQYNRDVRPILSNNCFFCHGFDEDKREAGLRLDTFEGATESGAVEPGAPESSSLIDRIFSDDPDLVMPPSDSAYALSSQQKDILKRWVEQGGDYEQHWAYKQLLRPKVTAGDQENPIDAFLQRTWTQAGVQPVASATPREIVRRLSYDLRGLPPSMEEVKAFQVDPSESSFRQLVDKWTRTTEYAEHQGLIWLDLVRWADSTGMVSDEPIATGAYRAYVIKAFRDNMPFDQFTREQLAGDLLAKPNDRTLVASGYNRLVKTNSEAGVIEKEALHALKGEHVRALGTVWLGATTGCAECHDHKYDPITAKDYYALAAFFDDLIEIGVYDPGDRRFPMHYLYKDSQYRAADDEISKAIDAARAELYDVEVPKDLLVEWEKATLAEFNRQSKRSDWAWLPAQLPPARISNGEYQQNEIGRVVQADAGQLVQHSVSEVMTGIIQKIKDGKTEFYFEVTTDPDDSPSAIGVQLIHGDYQRQGWAPDYFTTYFWGDKSFAEQFCSTVKDPARVVHVGPLPEAGEKAHLVVGKDVVKSSPHEPVGVAWIQVGGTVTWGDSGFNLSGKNAFSARLAESTNRYWWHLPWNRDDREHRMKLVVDSIKKPEADRREIHQKVIRFAYQEAKNPAAVERLRDLYRKLELVRQNAYEEALVSKVGPLKETKLRARGNFMDDSGERLRPQVPEYFWFSGGGDSNATKKRLDRLELANWLVDRRNPLTARVFVNRLWFQFYGRGISETLEDAGNQGDWPSHPELLDWLAVEFIESGWDVRHMIELMVTADAYRLTSVPTEQLAKTDPTNRFHARQNRKRHQAEEIRDSALKVAGLLQRTREIPTRSFFPYQPQAYWNKSNKIMFGSRHMVWATSQGASQYQRSLYTYWKRQNPHPSMLAFDSPTRQECTANRPTTNTPGQALALLNDPIFVEAARAFAESVLTGDNSNDDNERIRAIFQKSLQREPTSEEFELVGDALAKFRQHYQGDPVAAGELLSVGQKTSVELSPAEFAAWTAVCRMVLNLHEFITRS